MILMLLGCLVVLGGIFAYKGFVAYMTQQYIANMPPRTVVVSSTEVSRERWEYRIDAVGELTAYQGVEVTTEVAGQVE